MAAKDEGAATAVRGKWSKYLNKLAAPTYYRQRNEAEVSRLTAIRRTLDTFQCFGEISMFQTQIDNAVTQVNAMQAVQRTR